MNASAVETPTEAQAMNPTSFSVALWPKRARNRLPNNPLMAAPISGARTIHLSIVVVGWWLAPGGWWSVKSQPPTANHQPPLHSLSKSASSTLRVSRLRKSAMMIANPTAASAAATAITMKTNNWPVTSLCRRENAISERLTALSISSMHINSAMTLRWISTPTTPIVNKTALSARYHESGTMFQFAPERFVAPPLGGSGLVFKPFPPKGGATNASSGDLLFVFFFLLLRDQRLLDAFYIFLHLAAREKHRADNR